MADIRVIVLTRTIQSETTVVAVFESTDACEAYIVRLVRTNKMDDLAGLSMDSHVLMGGPHGVSKLYVRGTDYVTISDLTDVETTRA